MMKPNIRFLTKVRDREVYAYAGYSTRKGGYSGFNGGAATYKKHLQAGFVKHHGAPSLGLRAFVELTDLGEAALSQAKGEDQ